MSEPAVAFLSGSKYNIVFRAQGGTAMCDWDVAAAHDRKVYKPNRGVRWTPSPARTCKSGALVPYAGRLAV